MQDPMQSLLTQEALQPLLQPYVQLAQRNMALLTEFSASPEMMSLWMANSQKFLMQAVRGATDTQSEGDTRKMMEDVQSNLAQVTQSDAFSRLVKGLMENQAQFFFDLAQSGMAMLGQGQAQLMRQVQEASSNVVYVPGAEPQRGGAKRSRSA